MSCVCVSPLTKKQINFKGIIILCFVCCTTAYVFFVVVFPLTNMEKLNTQWPRLLVLDEWWNRRRMQTQGTNIIYISTCIKEKKENEHRKKGPEAYKYINFSSSSLFTNEITLKPNERKKGKEQKNNATITQFITCYIATD